MPALVLAGLTGAGLWATTPAAAAAIPDPTTTIALQQTGGAHGDADAKPFILAGEDATFDVTITNTSSSDGFNTSFTLSLPNGIDFVASGGMGTPVVYPSGAPLPNSAKTEAGEPLATVPAGSQVWVFQDVADLPATADYTSTITVRPDAATFPVGADPDVVLTGYVSGDPAMIPVFDGSTGAGGLAGATDTSSDVGTTGMPVQALRLTKHEPSPEIELLRGVHDHQTIYTLTVENTPEGDTTGVTVVDYLPAGLEFLACATVDNTASSPLLYDGAGNAGGSLEYPGTGLITGTSPADCILPVAVETVDSGIPGSLEPGVYTKVTWNLPDLTGGTPQPGDLSAAGVPGSYVITYAAAVPLFENTMDFITTAGDGTPTPATLSQASNLNNNNGPSTRQGQGAGFGDGILYDNLATVTGTYGGPLEPSASASVSDTDTEGIQAMDLRILKSVSTPDGDTFVTGALATYTLDLATSEYTSAGGASDPDPIGIVDTLGNGLCPALPDPATAEITGDPLPDDCPYPSGDSGATLTGAVATAIDYDATTGQFQVTYRLDPDAMTANDSHQIEYTALMRNAYVTHDPWVGPTTSRDSFLNEAEITGWTHAIPPLTGVTNGSSTPADGDEDVWDDSAAEIDSELSAISKQVLPRDAVIPTPGVESTAATSCDVAPGLPWAQNQTDLADAPFHAGDVVCYELTVDFANQIDVRNPKVTDFLPQDVAYLDWAVYTGTNGTTDEVTIDGFSRTGQRLEWLVGAPGEGGDRYVPLDSTLVIHVLGLVTSNTPADVSSLDKPENLMKYQQENVLGDVFYLREASAIQLGHGPTLLKGVRDVDGDPTLPATGQNDSDGAVFDSNRDGIEVAAGDVVTYRVDLTGGDFDADGMIVWDALPEGIGASDVSAIGNGGTALDPGDDGYPTGLDPGFSGRSVIVWTGVDLAAAAEDTLTYDVTIPADAEVNVDYDNTASITQYDVDLNTGDTQTLYPDGSLDTTRPADSTVPGEGTIDDSSVFTPDPTVAKTLVSTEIGPNASAGELDLDPNNGSAQAVQGELITYQYSVSIPAHTTVTDAVLRDRGTLLRGSTSVPYTVHGTPTWTASALTGATPDDFSLSTEDSTAGELTFPASYSNTSNDAQVFTVELMVYVEDAGANNATLTNRALFESDTWNGYDDQNVTYIEPNPQITKTASPSTGVTTSDPITYTLSVTNGGGRPISYDNVIVDTVPAGILIDEDSFNPAPTSYDAGVTTGTGGTITWNVDEVPPTATFSYNATIDPTTGGGESYTNTGLETGYTLPASIGGDDTSARRGERTDTDDATVTAVTAAIDKGVREAGTSDAFGPSISEPLGETVEYQVEVTLEADINYYDPVISDALPEGVVLQGDTITGPTASPSTGITGTWAYALDGGTNTATWTYDGDIGSHSSDRILTLTYDVLLDGGAIAANVSELDNTASFSWNSVNGDPSSSSSIGDDATVDVLDPVLAIDKAVSDEAPDPGDSFEYTVTVTNTGDTPAYNMTVTDTIPAGVIVDPSTITGGGELTEADADFGGGTISWDATDLPGPLHQTGSPSSPTSLVFTYQATLTASGNISDDESFTNTASVDHFESFPTDGRSYDPTNVDDTAMVDPPFPHVDLQKAVTSTDIAYVGTPLSWTLTATNTGDGPAQTVTLTDTLPPNWTYTAVTSVTVAGSAVSPAPAPSVTGSGDPDDEQRLVWTFGSGSSATPVLQPGQSIEIVFTATPEEAALTEPGATVAGPPVVHPPHTNTVAGETTDTSGATGNADGPYTGPEAEDDAVIHAADLRLQKEPGVGLVAGGPAGTAWTITVTNDGPDTAAGPVTVTDTWGESGVLPDGFAVTDVSGDGWSCSLTGTSPDNTGFDCVRTDPADTLAPGTSFPVITVTAQTAASFDLADSPVDNTASVTGGTYDTDPSDNEDDAEVPVTANADLTIQKTTSSPVTAGGPLTWTLTVANDGPSDSLSSTADPIQVTDEIPTGMQDVTLGPLPAGWSASPAGPYSAGDTVTLTLAAGERLTPADTAMFTLTGTIDPSWSANSDIPNTGEVSPGETTDPDPADNTDTATVTPGIDTTLGIDKTRVVWDGTAWVPATAATPAVPGQDVTYAVTVSNTGTADARNVEVLDQVEDYLAYQSVESVDGTWTRTSTTAAPGDDQTFALTGDLAAGGSASFRVTLLLDAGHQTGAEVANTVLGSADNSTNEPDDTDSTTDSDRSADLTITKSHTGDAIAGESLAYTITVTNLGPSVSSGPITIVDTLPGGFGYEAGSATVDVAGSGATPLEPVVSGQTLTWTVGDASSSLATGATIVVTFTATIDDDVTVGSYVNGAEVSGPDDDDPGNNHADDLTPVTPLTNLMITKAADSGPYVAGETVDYTLTIENAGPSVARDVSVTDVVPAGMTVTGMSGTGWTCDVVAVPAACTIPVLPVGSATIDATAQLSASVPEGADLTNTVTVSTSTPETSTADNSDDETIAVTTLADLGIVKTAVDDAGDPITTAVAGEQARYQLEVHNYGPSDAAAPMTIVDTLPRGITFVALADATSWDAVAGAVDPVTGEQTVTLTQRPAGSGLAAGADADLAMIVALDPTIPVDPVAGTATLTNSATVTSGTGEPAPDPHPNTDGAELTVTQAVDVSIVKTHDPGTVRIGDELTFELAVHNDGPSTATTVTVVDTIPAGLEYVDASGTDPAWSVHADPVAPDGTSTVTAALADPLGPIDDAPPLMITVRVTADAYGEIANVAVVSADQPETDSGDNTSDDAVTVPPQSALVVTKHLSSTLEVGSESSYLIAVTNRGPTEDPGPIVITDVLPPGLSYVSAAGTGASCDASGQTVTCTLAAPLGVDETVTVELGVRVASGAYPEVTNAVTVTTPTEQLPGSDLTDSTTDPAAADPLAHTGAAAPRWLVVAAILLLIAGGGFLAASRRRS